MDAVSQTIPGEKIEEPAASKPWQVSLFDLIRQQPLGAAGAFIVIIMVFLAVFANLVAPFDPIVNDYGSMHIPPDGTHWLGTDQFGRDVLSRLIYGARTALVVGFVSAFIGATAGLVLGVSSAFRFNFSTDYGCIHGLSAHHPGISRRIYIWYRC